MNPEINGVFCKNCSKNIKKPLNTHDVELVDSCFHVLIGKQKSVWEKCASYREAEISKKKALRIVGEGVGIWDCRNLK